MGFIKEFFEFIRVRKLYFFLPLILVLFLFATLVFWVSGAAIVPFIYTIF